MKKQIIFVILLLFANTLSAQLVLGLSGTYEHPTSKTTGIVNYMPGAELNLSYLFSQGKIMAGAAFNYKWIPNLTNDNLMAYFASLRFYPFNLDLNRPYIAGSFGYYHTKDVLKLSDGTTITILEDGAVISPSVGLLSAFRIISGVFWDFSISYHYYINEQRPSGVGLSAGLKYQF